MTFKTNAPKRHLRIVLVSMCVVLLCLMMNCGSTSADTATAKGAAFITRSDGIWYWPLPQKYYAKFSDWAGCPGLRNCPFHHVKHYGDSVHNGGSSYGHNGFDVATGKCDVYAAASGTAYISKGSSGRGWYVVIEHQVSDKWSYYSYYQHLSKISVSNGQKVSVGQVIGKAGNTGGNYGVHLHFGIVLGPTGLKVNAPNKLEGKGWLLTPDNKKGGRIVNNPALNSPAGEARGCYSSVTKAMKAHAGSVMYTFDKSQVSIGNSSFESVDKGRWYALSAEETNYYLSVEASAPSGSYPANRGIIITGFYPRGSKQSGKPTWYQTQDGYYIKASDLAAAPVTANSQMNDGETHDDVSIVVNSKSDHYALEAEPYSTNGRYPIKYVNKSDSLKIKAVWCNNQSKYWLETEDGLFIPAKDAVLNTSKSPQVSFKMGSDYKGPSLNGTSNYAPSTTSIALHGTITGNATITKVVAGWYWDIPLIDLPVIPECTIKDLDATAFSVNKDYKDASGKTQTSINNSLNAKTLIGKIRSLTGVSAGKEKGTIVYKIKVFYKTYVNVNSDSANPLQEVSSPCTVVSCRFTVGGGSSKIPTSVLVPVTGVSLDRSTATIQINGDAYGSCSLTATVSPANATSKKVNWTSSNKDVAAVVDGKVTAVGPGTAIITAEADDGSGKKAACTVTVQKKVTEVSVSPGSATLYVNGTSAEKTIRLTANVLPSDASNKSVTWSSSNAGVASVDQSGNVTAKAAGTATITAKANDGSGKQGTCTVTVRVWVDEITLSGPGSVKVGSTIRLTPVFSPANASGKGVTWTTGNAGIATVDQNGNVKGVKAGSVSITATATDRGSRKCVYAITVLQPVTGISLSGASSVLSGGAVTLTAAVQPSNASNKTLAWTTENSSVATVNNGVVTAVGKGTVTIWASATDGSGVKKPFSIRVLQPVTDIAISGENIVPVGGTVSLSTIILPADADNRTLAWTSSEPAIASVNSLGVVTGLQPGSAVITAEAMDGSGVSETCGIQVVQQLIAVRIEGDSLVHAGSTGQLTAIVTSDEPLSDTSVTWSTSDPAVATVSSSGVLTGIGNGTAVITATSNAESYYSAQHQVTVDTLVSQITVSGQNKADAGGAVQLTAAVSPASASNKQVVWSSSNQTVAAVDSQGKVQALSAGTATITAAATDGSGVKGTLKITVYPLPSQINLAGETALLAGGTAQLTAEVLPANARNKNVTWTTSDASVATVDAGGLVTAHDNGTAVITAAAAGNPSVTAQHEVTVTTLVSEITLDAPERIDVGEMGAVTAAVLPVTASDQRLVWTSSNEEIAVVDADGNVFGRSSGYVTIAAEAVDGSGVTAEAEIQIFQYMQDISVEVEPVAYVGQRLDPSVIILPEDASEPYVSWTSSNESVIRIDEIETDSEYTLQAVCLSPGVARITATADDGSGVSGYAYVQVLPYTELMENTAAFTLYPGGETRGVIGQVSLTSDCAARAAEEKHGAVWTIEHVSGDYAAALGLNEHTWAYSGFSLANSVDLMLLGINRTGQDTYRVTCTINGQADTCLVTVSVEEPAAPLPESVSLPVTEFHAAVGEEIAMNVTPVVSPATAALPADASSFLFGVDSFNRYARVLMGEDVFTVTFSRAGVYTAYVRYQGANYQYDAYATFVITTPEGTVPPEIEALSIENSAMYLLPGETARFDVNISPSGADESALQWSSSDPDVVTVAADGTLTAVSPGTSIITVSAGNGLTATGYAVVTESLLSIDWNPGDMIEVFVEGESRTVIQRVYLTPRASAQLTEAPVWTIRRLSGSNLTLTCEPVTAAGAGGVTLYGCAIVLRSVSGTGTTEYELTCSDGAHSASTTVLVNASSREDRLPSMLQWGSSTFTGTVNERMTICPAVQCWPAGTALPDEVTISIWGDSFWNAALITEELTISRSMITLAFREAGVYTADCVYACANMRYLVPITVRVAGSDGTVPVRLTQLTLNREEISIRAGDTEQLTAAFAPADATNRSVSWSSDNPSVATVSADGLVTGVANGRANITCTPADSNCAPVRCAVIVEDVFTVTRFQEMDFQYLQGDPGNPAAGFRLSDGTARRVEAEGLTPAWSLSRVSGNAANVELRNWDGTQYVVVTELLAGGVDTYQVTCAAGDYVWTDQVQLEVYDLGAAAPARVTVAQSLYTASVGEVIELDFTPVCEPAGTSIPAALEADYIGIGDIYSALEDAYRYALFTAGDTFSLAFRKPGVYLLSRQYTSCNLTYVTECTIAVDDGSLSLLKCTDDEPVVYIGGKSAIASTCIIRDTSIEELYGDQLVWSAERISGDCLTVALRTDQSSASLYVVNAKEEGEEVWRVSCAFKGITDSVDITIHAVQARTELPEQAALYQTDFDGMIGNVIMVPLAVSCSPEGTSLPVTDDGAWSFSTDGNTRAHAAWSFTDGQMKIVFSGSGYYGGELVYQSGNVSYRFPVSFAITDEESVQAEPAHLAVSLSDEALTVYPEGETGIAIVNAVLTDSLDAYSLASVAAYAERNNAVWSVQILSGNACALSVSSRSAASVQLVLDSMAGSGDVTYQIQCSVGGRTASAQGTVHVASADEARPQPELRQSYFTTPAGTALTVDASLYDHTHTIKLCSGRDSIWENAEALAAMGFACETSGDLLLPVFYEPGSYTTAIISRIGNLTFSRELIIAVYTSRTLPPAASWLSFPMVLQEIEDGAFEGISVQVIDLRGSSVTTIGSRAFANVEGLMRVYLPASVTSISTSAFADCTDFVICCPEGSAADAWAHSMKYPVIDDMD